MERPPRDSLPSSPFWALLLMLCAEPALAWLRETLFPPPAPASATASPRNRRRRRRARGRPEDRARNGDHLHEGRTLRDTRQPASDPLHLETLRLVEQAEHSRIWKAAFRSFRLFVAFREGTASPSIWPIPPHQVAGFLVSLDRQAIPTPKILKHLAGLSWISRCLHFQDPLQDFRTSCMLRSFLWQRRPQAGNCRPVTIEMLRCLVGTVERACGSFYEQLLFLAVYVLAFFGALRPEEIVAEDSTMPNPDLLQLGDCDVLDNCIGLRRRVLNRSLVCLRLSPEPWVCPVLALRNFLAARPRTGGPLFIYGNGQALSKERFLEVFSSALRLLGVPPEQYNLHSFWRGSVETSARYGYPRQVICRLARWPPPNSPSS